MAKHPDPDIEKKLATICSQCGEEYGMHRKSDNACPERDGDRRFAAYSKTKVFVEWVEEPLPPST